MLDLRDVIIILKFFSSYCEYIMNLCTRGICITYINSIHFFFHKLREDRNFIYFVLNKTIKYFSDMEEGNVREIEFQNSTFRMKQDSALGIPGVVWDCALVYLAWLNKNFSSIQEKYKVSEKKVIELGSGTGICGIAFSLLHPKKLVLTDMKPNLENITRNIKENEKCLQERGVNSEEISVEVLNWGESQPDTKTLIDRHGPFDLIIGSDLIYSDKDKADLLWTLTTLSLAAKNNVTVILGYTIHKPSDKKFFEMAKTNWNVQHISYWDFDPEYQAEDIGIAIMTPKE
jgi:hypothetical protein